jgi:DNA-binding ferritin-like protein
MPINSSAPSSGSDPGRVDVAAHARAVARLVNPLIADALALRRGLERSPAADAAAAGTPPDGRDAHPLFAVFADQMRASADLMGECVRAAGGRPRARRADARADARAAAAPPDEGAAPPGEAARRLLENGERMAGHLRRAIAECDARGDDRTADRLEEVLDEVLWQRRFLSDLLPEAPR